jgi:hypothetical protein
MEDALLKIKIGQLKPEEKMVQKLEQGNQLIE